MEGRSVVTSNQFVSLLKFPKSILMLVMTRYGAVVGSVWGPTLTGRDDS